MTTLADVKVADAIGGGPKDLALAAIIADMPTIRLVGAWVAYSGTFVLPAELDLEAAWRRVWPRGPRVPMLANMAGMTPDMTLERLTSLKDLGLILPDGVTRMTALLLQGEIAGEIAMPAPEPVAPAGGRRDFGRRRGGE